MNIFRILDSGQVMRWHSSPQMNRLNQSNSAHTWGVMAIAEFLCEDLCNLNFFRHVLYHDCGEIATGDVSSNVKRRRADLSLILKQEENDEIRRMCVDMPPVSTAQLTLAKLADILEAHYHILQYAVYPKQVEGWTKSVETCTDLVVEMARHGYDVFPKIDFTFNQLIRDRDIRDENGELICITPF